MTAVETATAVTARCTEPDINAEDFFPLVATIRQLHTAAATARRYCGPCPLRTRCRALGTRQTAGIWGGVLRSDDGRGSTTSIDLLAPLPATLKEAKRP